MKKTVILLAVTAVVAGLILAVPGWIRKSVPEVSLTQAETFRYTETVTADGTVEYAEKQSVEVELPLIPGEVYVEVGDAVRVGDVLAEVDAVQTVDAMLSLLDWTSGELSKQVTETIAGQETALDDVRDYLPTQIVANANGILTDLQLVPGGLVMPNTSVATIASTEDLQVRMSVNENLISEVEVGQSATVRGSAFGDHIYHATVTKIAPSARKKVSGTAQETVVDVLLKFTDPDGEIRSGNTVTAEIQVKPEREILMLPYTAVGQDLTGEYVLVYQAGRAERRVVQTGLENENGVEICSGIGADDWIISNVGELSDGDHVRVGKTED